MSALVRRINAAARGGRPRGRSRCRRPTRRAGSWTALAAKADEVRKQIVATKEGGAITGEERLREHMDQLYGAILSYEGRPADYQLQRIDVLTSELADVESAFQGVLKAELPAANAALRKKKRAAIAVP